MGMTRRRSLQNLLLQLLLLPSLLRLLPSPPLLLQRSLLLLLPSPPLLALRPPSPLLPRHTRSLHRVVRQGAAGAVAGAPLVRRLLLAYGPW